MVCHRPPRALRRAWQHLLPAHHGHADPALQRAMHEIRVQAWLERGQLDAALATVQRERLRPSYPHDVAQALLRAGRRTEALALAATIRTHTPLQARAVANLLVDLHLEMGDVDGAQEVLRTRPTASLWRGPGRTPSRGTSPPSHRSAARASETSHSRVASAASRPCFDGVATLQSAR